MRQSLWARPALSLGWRPAWLRLPLLCCEAAGGDPRLAEPLAAAWALLYAAAHLLDSVQDGDLPDAWWAPLGPGPAINAATGLIASCVLLLLSSQSQPGTISTVERQLTDYFRTVLHMGSGQHLDLTAGSPSLQECWRIAEAKSGAFFGLACRAGARAAGIDERLVSHYSTYGVSLGLLLQMGDDLTDLAAGDPAEGGTALPMAYFLSVAPAAAQTMMAAGSGPSAEARPPATTAELLDASGAGLYLAIKARQLRQRGAAALHRAAQSSPALEQLLEMLESTPPAL